MLTYKIFINSSVNSLTILRHDVDKYPENSLRFAKIQHELGISGTYYFRIVPQSYNEKIIKEIASLGHEIGYHYETLDTCRGDVDKAYDEFCRNLEKFRKLAPISTISMHGSPLSKYDNRDIWKKYDYRKLGIIGEPYFDIDFTKVLYLTDTGRRWDGHKVSVRDKPIEGREAGRQGSGEESKRRGTGEEETEIKFPTTHDSRLTTHDPNKKLNDIYSFHSTFDIIRAIEKGELPDQVMFNFHPQRWTDKPLPWLRELVMQNAKNLVKRALVSVRR